MKLYTVAVTAVFLCIISCSLRNAVWFAARLEQKVQQEFLSYSAKKFIAQSFKNTCAKKGFKSLEQWQLTCSAIFALEDISYEKCSEKCIADKSLYYAKWHGSGKLVSCSAQVYCLVEKEDFNET